MNKRIKNTTKGKKRRSLYVQSLLNRVKHLKPQMDTNFEALNAMSRQELEQLLEDIQRIPQLLAVFPSLANVIDRINEAIIALAEVEEQVVPNVVEAPVGQAPEVAPLNLPEAEGSDSIISSVSANMDSSTSRSSPLTPLSSPPQEIPPSPQHHISSSESDSPPQKVPKLETNSDRPESGGVQ